MANTTFLADTTIPGLSAVDLFRVAASAIFGGSADHVDDYAHEVSDYRLSRDIRGLDRHLLRDLGFDRSHC